MMKAHESATENLQITLMGELVFTDPGLLGACTGDGE